MSDAHHAAELDAITNAYRATRYANYLGVSGLVFILADFLHTFPNEVRLMWPTPLSAPKVLFFGLRYYILVHQAIALIYGLPTDLSPKECTSTFVGIGVSSILVGTTAEAILFLRVYAFSGRNKKLLVFLIIQFVAIHATAFALLTKFLQTAKFVQLPIKGLVCVPAEAKNAMLGGVFSLYLGSIVIAMFVMMYLAFNKHRGFNSSLLTMFYRDGIFYFICMSALATANIVVNFAAPDGGFKFILVQPEIDTHAILATRMLLHLRGWAEREDKMNAMGTVTMGAMEYSAVNRRLVRLRRAPSPMQFQDRALVETVKSRTRTTIHEVQSVPEVSAPVEGSVGGPTP